MSGLSLPPAGCGPVRLMSSEAGSRGQSQSPAELPDAPSRWSLVKCPPCGVAGDRVRTARPESCFADGPTRGLRRDDHRREANDLCLLLARRRAYSPRLIRDSRCHDGIRIVRAAPHQPEGKDWHGQCGTHCGEDKRALLGHGAGVLSNPHKSGAFHVPTPLGSKAGPAALVPGVSRPRPDTTCGVMPQCGQ
jgi:hypothetical protein